MRVSANAVLTSLKQSLDHRGQRLSPVPLRGIHLRDDGFYETTETDAAFSLVPNREQAGWRILSFLLEAQATQSLRIAFMQQLDHRDHADFSLLRLGAGRFARVFHVPPGTVKIELQVAHPSGPFRISDIRVREINLLAVIGLLVKAPILLQLVGRFLYKYGVSNAYLRIRAVLSDEYSQNYRKWVERYDTLDHERRKALGRLYARKKTPLVSVIANIESLEHAGVGSLIHACVDQIYTKWELCLVGASATIREAQSNTPAHSSSVRWVVAEAEDSVAKRLNKGLAEAQGEFLFFASGVHEPRPHAFTLMAEAMLAGADIVYADEDQIDSEGLRTQPDFKQGWNPDLLLARDYISSTMMLRSTRVLSVGGFREGFDGAEQYDLLLRTMGQNLRAKILHIPHILFHRIAAVDSGAVTAESGRRAVEAYLVPQGSSVEVTMQSAVSRRIRYKHRDGVKLVSIIIPTRDRGDLLEGCVRSVLEKTIDIPFEVLIVDNDSREQKTLDFLEVCSQDPRVKVIKDSGTFNYSRINNLAAKEARGDVLVLLNNDTEVINPDWLVEMSSLARRPEVGAVGAKLLYPSGHVQHSGVLSSPLYGIDHVGRGMGRYEPGYRGRTLYVQNCMAVTGACLAVRKELYVEVGGLDTSLAVTFNDVDLCFRISQKGYRILWTPHAELFHLESASRGPGGTEVDRSFRVMRKRWKAILDSHVYCNPNLTPVHSASFPDMPLSCDDFVLASPPTIDRPWESRLSFSDLAATGSFESNLQAG